MIDTYAECDAIVIRTGKLCDELRASFFLGIVQGTETTDDFNAVYGSDFSLSGHRACCRESSTGNRNDNVGQL